MMWLAAHLDLADGDIVARPHTQASAKGQDFLVVHRNEQSVVALTICDDKATDNARNIGREEVWPEIAAYEAGGRRDKLRSNVIATLGLAGIPEEESIALVRRTPEKELRRYRVRVASSGTRTKTLFKGFDDVVPGPLERRRGESVNIPHLRKWMAELAGKVEAALRDYATGGLGPEQAVTVASW
ncbi:MAG: hypothetical protein AAGA48_34120 [Myxococcota bacterium]